MTSEDVLKALAGGRQPKDDVFTLCLYLGVSEKHHSCLFHGYFNSSHWFIILSRTQV